MPANFSIQLGRGDEYRSNIDIYHRLVRKVRRTRYWDEEALRALGIEEDLQNVLGRIGLWTFFQRRCNTYQCLTVEFLSTLRINRQRQGDFPMSINFRLGNTDRQLTMSELNRIFATPEDPQGRLYTFNRNFHVDEAWGSLCHTQTNPVTFYHNSNSRPSRIRNPTMRYFEKMLSCSLCARSGLCPMGLGLEVLYLKFSVTRARIQM